MNKKTATEMLAQIGNDFFKGVDLAEASLLKGDERRAFRLTQVERLLTEQYDSSPLAMWQSDIFWTADEGRVQMEPVNPLLSLTDQQTLTDEDMQRLWLNQSRKRRLSSLRLQLKDPRWRSKCNQFHHLLWNV